MISQVRFNPGDLIIWIGFGRDPSKLLGLVIASDNIRFQYRPVGLLNWLHGNVEVRKIRSTNVILQQQYEFLSFRKLET